MYRIMFLMLIIIYPVLAWGSNDRVKLKDVETLTLYKGKMATARRSYSIPQVKCIGGSANCRFVPDVVQCKNSGFDGYDVQWECKSDMEDFYKFGRIEVVCEGYDYPDDPYILRGSCGLEFMLELTEKGKNHFSGDGYYRDTSEKTRPSGKNPLLGNIILFAMVALIIYGVYKTCLRNNQYSPTDDGSDPHQGGRWSSGNTFGTAPGPGFRPEYTSHGDGCARTFTTGNTGSGTGGFWTGAATGGLLGYLFGSRNARSDYFQSGPSFAQRSDWGWRDNSGSTNTETRTASGYGGTRRR